VEINEKLVYLVGVVLLGMVGNTLVGIVWGEVLSRDLCFLLAGYGPIIEEYAGVWSWVVCE
jgi:hypothetical protein